MPSQHAAPDPSTIEQVQHRATVALAEARRFRHSGDCQCRAFQGRWCTPGEGVWTRALDRELDLLARLQLLEDASTTTTDSGGS